MQDEQRSGPVGSEPHSARGLLTMALEDATGRRHRTDPVLPRSGGPAGNANLTAWTGQALLVLSLAELMTLLDTRGLISWHVAIGALLVPPALLKTASTGWRMGSYYLHRQPYVTAGPPPTLLRLLGPLVVVSTLGLLGTGIWLVLLGPGAAQQPLVTALGLGLAPLTFHQSFFAVWCVATGTHVLCRLVPALGLSYGTRGSVPLPGSRARWLLLAFTAASSGALAVALVGADGSWA